MVSATSDACLHPVASSLAAARDLVEADGVEWQLLCQTAVEPGIQRTAGAKATADRSREV